MSDCQCINYGGRDTRFCPIHCEKPQRDPALDLPPPHLLLIAVLVVLLIVAYYAVVLLLWPWLSRVLG